jgi:hypothetical protein
LLVFTFDLNHPHHDTINHVHWFALFIILWLLICGRIFILSFLLINNLHSDWVVLECLILIVWLTVKLLLLLVASVWLVN